MDKLNELNPKRVFHYFSEISKIPRCSGEEKDLSDYLKNLGNNLALETIQDEWNNIIIRKPATKGYEDSQGVILQGHMDMVCEKEENIDHDFSKDPIEIIVEDDYIKAKGTTLGADNGIALAMGLAIIEDSSLKHPSLELLLTTSEETEMTGALGLRGNLLKGSRLLNLDSEEEGYLVAGSAGGELIKVGLDIKPELNDSYTGISIALAGLKGGHSGMEIHKERANALKLSVHILKRLDESLDIKLSSIDGGTKESAIPRQIEIILGVKKEDLEKLEYEVSKIEEDLKESFKSESPKIIVGPIPNLESTLSKKDLENIIFLLDSLPTGVNSWIPKRENVVESSSNLAIIERKANTIKIFISTRSSNPSVLTDIRGRIVNKIESIGAKYEISGSYPEWEYEESSQLRHKALEIYEKMFASEMKVTVLHAGLEPGAFKRTYSDLDIISLGPNIYHVHTPQEKLSISSTERSYNYLVTLLENLR